MGMEDVETDVVINCDGTAAAAGVNSVNEAMRGMVGAHGAIKNAFAERFEHVGVHLFGMDLLRTIGITEGARPVLTLLQSGITGVAEAFGFATGPIGMAVFGLTAAAAIAYRIVEGHAKHAESLEKVARKQEDALKTTTSLSDKMTQYQEAVGRATPELDNLTSATSRLDEIQRRRLTSTEGEQMSALQKQMESTRQHAEELDRLAEHAERANKALGMGAGGMERPADTRKRAEELREEYDKLHQQFEKIKADIKAQGEGYLDLEDKMSKVKKADPMGDDKGFDEWNKRQDAMIAFQAKFRAENEKAATNYNKAMESMRGEQLKYQIELDKMMQKDDAWGNGLRSTATSAFNAIESRSSSAFAKMIVEGKSATEAFKGFFKDMAEQVIADLIRMIEKQLIFNALESAMAPGLGPGVAVLSESQRGSLFMHATGADYVVDRPTRFVAGEAGAERVQVTPLGQASPSGSSGGPQPVSINVSIQAPGVVTDIKAFGDMVGEQVLRAIRGQGQLTFTRAS